MADRYSPPGAVIYNGRVVLEAQSIAFKVETDNKSVKTLTGGRVGHSRGAQEVMVEVENAIPEQGFEIDWVGIARAQAVVRVAFRIGIKTYNCKGDVRGAEWRTDVDGINKLSFSLSGIVESES